VVWKPALHADRPVDLAARSDGSLVLEAAGKLYVLRASGRRTPFAPAYGAPAGSEAYIAVPAPSHGGCSFGRDAVYAIRFRDGRGITRVSRAGHVGLFARISAPGLINGIAFDETGAFAHRLLVTTNHGSTTTLNAISCTGQVTTITSTAPRLEGGIAVAPRTFGRFAGDLIAPDELGGLIYAVTPRGRTFVVAPSGLPHGQDFGVESETFVPGDAHARFLVADRGTPGNPHPGDDVLLEAGFGGLEAAGLLPGDLLVAGEGGALTDAVRCGARTCSVRYIAKGPPEAHVEGHIAFFR
jgi:hypothetical protein